MEDQDLRGRVARLSLEQKVRLLTGADFWALYPEPDAGLRRVVTSDGPAGVRGERWDERDTSANIPSPTALAATWDCDRVEAIGRLLAAEARRKGVDVLLAPTVNLHRTPYGGRHFECFSEDPLLTARIGVAYVRGLQGQGVAATVKHFICNDSETERMSVDVRIDERTLRELYLAPFEAIVREAGAWAVMASYNRVNGPTMTESPLLRTILHDEWGYDGLVMSDWTATRSTEAAARAALDLAMPGPAERFGPWGGALLAAVRAGQVDEALLDDKVLRILRLAARVGGLDGAVPVTPVPVDIPRELRAAAAVSFVLARNERSLLPLDRSRLAGAGLDGAGLGRVALIGPNAEIARTLGGGSATVYPPYTISPLDGLRAAGLDVAYAPGTLGHLRAGPARSPWLLRPDPSDLPGGARGGRPPRSQQSPGADVRFFTSSGELIGAEQRGAAVFRWMSGFAVVGAPEPIDRLEVSCLIRATEAGSYRLGVAGIGRFRLLADEAVVFDETLTVRQGADVGETLMAPPVRLAPVELATGQSVAVRLEHDVHSSPMAGFGTFFQLVLEPPHGTDDEEMEAAVALAAGSDVAVVVVGTTAEVESEGFDRSSLALPGRQDELVRKVAAANPRTVVVVNSGAPVLLPWADEVGAVLLTWFGGQEFGNALADVLLGQAEPGGRLPTTWPASEDGLLSARPDDGVLSYTEGLFIGYRAFDRDGREPLFPFGHGRGYTTWSYESITVDCAEANPSRAVLAPGGTTPPGTPPHPPGPPGGVAVCVEVRNTGSRPGREVVQVYASRPDSAVERPARWLAGFAAVDAGPGETVNVGILLPERAFQHWADGGWTLESGTFALAAGSSSASLPLTAGVTLK
jgi:beta-glucosidase